MKLATSLERALSNTLSHGIVFDPSILLFASIDEHIVAREEFHCLLVDSNMSRPILECLIRNPECLHGLLIVCRGMHTILEISFCSH